MFKKIRYILLFVVVFLTCTSIISASYDITLKSRRLIPEEGLDDTTNANIGSIPGKATHFDSIILDSNK